MFQDFHITKGNLSGKVYSSKWFSSFISNNKNILDNLYTLKAMELDKGVVK